MGVVTYGRIKAEQFAFRIMKEVRSYVANGGALDHAKAGMVIALAHLCDLTEQEIADALRRPNKLDPRSPPSDWNVSPGQDKGK